MSGPRASSRSSGLEGRRTFDPAPFAARRRRPHSARRRRVASPATCPACASRPRARAEADPSGSPKVVPSTLLQWLRSTATEPREINAHLRSCSRHPLRRCYGRLPRPAEDAATVRPTPLSAAATPSTGCSNSRRRQQRSRADGAQPKADADENAADGKSTPCIGRWTKITSDALPRLPAFEAAPVLMTARPVENSKPLDADRLERRLDAEAGAARRG